jgi:hypothetical protein
LTGWPFHSTKCERTTPRRVQRRMCAKSRAGIGTGGLPLVGCPLEAAQPVLVPIEADLAAWFRSQGDIIREINNLSRSTWIRAYPESLNSIRTPSRRHCRNNRTKPHRARGRQVIASGRRTSCILGNLKSRV